MGTDWIGPGAILPPPPPPKSGHGLYNPIWYSLLPTIYYQSVPGLDDVCIRLMWPILKLSGTDHATTDYPLLYWTACYEDSSYNYSDKQQQTQQTIISAASNTVMLPFPGAFLILLIHSRAFHTGSAWGSAQKVRNLVASETSETKSHSLAIYDFCLQK